MSSWYSLIWKTPTATLYPGAVAEDEVDNAKAVTVRVGSHDFCKPSIPAQSIRSRDLVGSS